MQMIFSWREVYKKETFLPNILLGLFLATNGLFLTRAPRWSNCHCTLRCSCPACGVAYRFLYYFK